MNLKEKIHAARLQNPQKGSKLIAKLVGCSPTTVRYYLTTGYKTGCLHRQSRARRERAAAMKIGAGGRCQRCGYSKCLAALHFHHKNKNSKKAASWPS